MPTDQTGRKERCKQVTKTRTLDYVTIKVTSDETTLKRAIEQLESCFDVLERSRILVNTRDNSSHCYIRALIETGEETGIPYYGDDPTQRRR